MYSVRGNRKRPSHDAFRESPFLTMEDHFTGLLYEYGIFKRNSVLYLSNWLRASISRCHSHPRYGQDQRSSSTVDMNSKLLRLSRVSLCKNRQTSAVLDCLDWIPPLFVSCGSGDTDASGREYTAYKDPLEILRDAVPSARTRSTVRVSM